jgi:ferric-dicitrate binding protein FerR (iron transport regulator)
MQNETTNWDAIARYLAGEGSAEEQAAVRRWLADHPDDARVVGALDGVLSRLKPDADFGRSIDVEAALASVNARRSRPELRVVRGPASRIREVGAARRSRWMPYAAAAAAAAVLFVGAREFADRRSSATGAPTVAARTLTTPAGGRDSVLLPDGTRVTLGPGSALTMAEGFGESERRVSLTGDAFFTVVHDDAKPFIVTANGATIRDIGTAFVVHSDSSGVRVAVTEGIVEVNSTGRPSTTLNAGDAAAVSPTGDVSTQRGVGAADDLAWVTGRLVFRDAALTEVSEDLRRWYGVTLNIPEPALRRRLYTGSFQGDSLGSVLDAIAAAVGATVQRQPGDTIVFRSLPR